MSVPVELIPPGDWESIEQKCKRVELTPDQLRVIALVEAMIGFRKGLDGQDFATHNEIAGFLDRGSRGTAVMMKALVRKGYLMTCELRDDKGAGPKKEYPGYGATSLGQEVLKRAGVTLPRVVAAEELASPV